MNTLGLNRLHVIIMSTKSEHIATSLRFLALCDLFLTILSHALPSHGNRTPHSRLADPFHRREPTSMGNKGDLFTNYTQTSTCLQTYREVFGDEGRCHIIAINQHAVIGFHIRVISVDLDRIIT